MNHQPFEKWIFEDESLDPQQQENLNAHLETCETCSDLTIALTQFENTVHHSPSPNPTPGFTQRWKDRLHRYRYQRQQQRLWIFTFSLFAIATIILITIFVLNQSKWNIFYEFGLFVGTLGQIGGRINQFWAIFIALLSRVPILAPIMFIFGIGTFSVIIVLMITWFSSMIKLYQPVKQGVFER